MKQKNHDLKTITEINPRDFELFVGMDVDKPGISMAVSNWEEGIILNHRTPYDASHILNFLNKRFPDTSIVFAYEAGPTGFGLFDQLTDAGFACLVVTPSLVPQNAMERNKTNRLDARKLSLSLRGGELKGVRVPQGPYRRLRDLVHLRQVTTRHCSGTMCRIKMLLLNKGIEFPGERWSQEVLAKLESAPELESLRFELDILLAQLRFRQQQKKEIQTEVRAHCRAHQELEEYVGYLETIPGIGFTTATEILARIGDPSQLKRCKELGCFFGLTPWESSTGDRQTKDHITGMGDGYARNLLIEAAWVAIRHDAELRGFFHRISSKHPKDRGRKIAIVAVANKLARRIYAVLKQRRAFETRPPQKPEQCPEKQKRKATKKRLTEMMLEQTAESESQHQVTVRGEDGEKLS
ncbi:MAG: IS110 family transposase [Planctomycetota bacterium]|nr:IS110 family transposase [Planctomycetota bacterium]